MANERDAATFLQSVRKKYPVYANYDDVTLLSAIQKKYPQYRDISLSKVRNTESLLQGAIKNVNPFFDQGDIPKIAFQGAQGIVSNAPQNIAENPALAAVGGLPSVQFKSGAQAITGIKKLFMGGDSVEPETTDFSDKYMNPKSPGGKMAGIAANIAGSTLFPIGGAAVTAKNAFTPFRRFPIEKRAGQLARDAEEISYSGAKQIKSGLENDFQKAREMYRSVVDSEDVSDISTKDLIKVLDDVILEKKISGKRFRTPADENILDMRNRVASKVKEATPDIVEEVRDPLTNQPHRFITEKGSPAIDPKMSMVEEVKNFKNMVFDSIKGQSDLEGSFLRHFGQMLEDKGHGAINQASKAYRRVYDLVKESKALKIGSPSIKKLATGRTGSTQTSDMVSFGKKMGTKVIDQASKIGQEVASNNNKLLLAIRNQNRVKALAGLTGTGAAVTGLFNLGKAFEKR